MNRSVAFIVPSRDKAGKVAMCVKSVLCQTYSPMKLVFSDQGSTDGTREEIEQLVQQYRGPNEVVLLSCPLTEPRGMAGIHAHINWIVENVDADIFIMSSCDDVAHPERAAKVVAAFEEFDPDMVLTAQEFLDPDTHEQSFTAWPLETRFLKGTDVIERLSGGSSSQAWTKEFYNKIGGLHGVVCPDVMMPFLATQNKGAYFLHEPLHCYMNWADANNAGLGGVMRATTDEDEIVRLREVEQYQIVSTLVQSAVIAGTVCSNLDQVSIQALYQDMINRTFAWTAARDILTEKKIQPLSLRS